MFLILREHLTKVFKELYFDFCVIFFSMICTKMQVFNVHLGSNYHLQNERWLFSELFSTGLQREWKHGKHGYISIRFADKI